MKGWPKSQRKGEAVLKNYRAVFFDWDGTAVLSRKAPADEAINAMRPLLQKGVKLIIVSGTTLENIAAGKITEAFSKEELKNFYLGLGRGAYNYCFDDEGKPFIFKNTIPQKDTLLDIHRVCFDIHERLLKDHDLNTDIVFSRPNYCKIDLMVDNNRGEALFLQENEVEGLKGLLKEHGIEGGLNGLIQMADEEAEKYGLNVRTTCDGKYLEVGISDKSDNVNVILDKLKEEYDIKPSECAFWGDEYIGIDEGIYGSDSFMITEKSIEGDFFDVSDIPGKRPDNVKVLGGKVKTFIEFLRANH